MKYTTRPIANQTKNHFQLEADIPVNRYKQDVKPNNGIKEKFFIKLNTDRATQINQKTIVAILTAAVWKLYCEAFSEAE